MIIFDIDPEDFRMWKLLKLKQSDCCKITTEIFRSPENCLSINNSMRISIVLSKAKIYKLFILNLKK